MGRIKLCFLRKLMWCVVLFSVAFVIGYVGGKSFMKTLGQDP